MALSPHTGGRAARWCVVKLWYATFGDGHTHPITGESLRDAYTLVPGDTYEDAHQAMTRSVFGRQWAFLYENADNHRGAGVARFGLHEVPFVPSSPVGVAMWAAYDKAIADHPMAHPHGVAQVMAEAAELAWQAREVLDAIAGLER